MVRFQCKRCKSTLVSNGSQKKGTCPNCLTINEVPEKKLSVEDAVMADLEEENSYPYVVPSYKPIPRQMDSSIENLSRSPVVHWTIPAILLVVLLQLFLGLMNEVRYQKYTKAASNLERVIDQIDQEEARRILGELAGK